LVYKNLKGKKKSGRKRLRWKFGKAYNRHGSRPAVLPKNRRDPLKRWKRSRQRKGRARGWVGCKRVGAIAVLRKKPAHASRSSANKGGGGDKRQTERKTDGSLSFPRKGSKRTPGLASGLDHWGKKELQMGKKKGETEGQVTGERKTSEITWGALRKDQSRKRKEKDTFEHLNLHNASIGGRPGTALGEKTKAPSM